jgi:uncharacterized NAD-dependent epimerase/dehydratase family protein
VLCHDLERATIKGFEREGLPLRSLPALIGIYEDAASWRHAPGFPRARVVGIAVKTSPFEDRYAADQLAEIERQTGLPAVDPVREGPAGADRLAAAVLG